MHIHTHQCRQKKNHHTIQVSSHAFRIQVNIHRPMSPPTRTTYAFNVHTYNPTHSLTRPAS